MSVQFQIAETDTFRDRVVSNPEDLPYEKIVAYVYPQLRKNPFFGANIKKLRGEFEGVYRYRRGDRRLFYSIDGDKGLVVILDIQPRKDAYRKRR